jgi:hypothetical protein
LLTGAWAGCKIAAIGRSSKVSALARQLEVPYCIPPLTIDKLKELQSQAVAVDPKRLSQMSETARAGIAFALTGERPPPASIEAKPARMEPKTGDSSFPAKEQPASNLNRQLQKI